MRELIEKRFRIELKPQKRVEIRVETDEDGVRKEIEVEEYDWFLHINTA